MATTTLPLPSSLPSLEHLLGVRACVGTGDTAAERRGRLLSWGLMLLRSKKPNRRPRGALGLGEEPCVLVSLIPIPATPPPLGSPLTAQAQGPSSGPPSVGSAGEGSLEWSTVQEGGRVGFWRE